MQKRRRIMAIVLTVLFALAVMLSLDFVADNYEHDCEGTDCAICAVLQVADEIVNGAKKVVSISALFAFSAIILFIVKARKECFVSAVTPVSLNDILII